MRSNLIGINDRPLRVHTDIGMNDHLITREPSHHLYLLLKFEILQIYWEER